MLFSCRYNSLVFQCVFGSTDASFIMQIMLHLITVFGQWKMGNVGGEFILDQCKKGNSFFVEEDIKYEDFHRMVCEDYNISEMNAVEFCYMLPKRITEQMDSKAVPMSLSNDRQLECFITLLKTDVMCIHVSLIANKGRCDMNRNQKHAVRENAAADFDSFGNVQYETMKPSPETMKPSGETIKPSELRKTETIKSGDMFSCKGELILKLKKLSVIDRFDFNIKKSRKNLFYAKCFVPGCSWMIRATTMSTSSPLFFVRKYIDVHTCSAAVRYSRNRQANWQCIGKMYVEEFSGGSDLKGIRPKHIQDCVRASYKIEIDYTKAHKALAYARDMVRGTHASGYQDLPTYLYRIKKANPGTITELELDADSRFKYLFIAFSASIKGFPFMRRVIVIDGAHLSGKFRGVMLVACCQDGDKGIYPIAFGIVNGEDAVAWEWFFTQLRRVVGDGRNLAFVSDRCASIAKALTNVFPDADRGICLYHLGQNMITGRKKNPMVDAAKNAAWLCRRSDFDAVFEVIRQQDSSLHKYFTTADIKLWTRSYFPGHRYDIMTSNFAESINSALKEERAFPIAYFVESIRKMLSRWFAERREKAVSLKTNFTEYVEHELHSRHTNMGTLVVQHIDAIRSHVTGGDRNCVVNLETMSCTCRQFDLDKIPCEHAIKVAQSRKIDEATLVDPVYTKGYLVAAYEEPINPIDEDLLPPEDVLSQVCLPPIIGKQRGRPKMKRYLSAIERAKRFKRNLLRKKNQTLSTSNPPPVTKKGDQCSQKTSTKICGRSQAPSTPLKKMQTKPRRRTPSTNPTSTKKRGRSPAPSTPLNEKQTNPARRGPSTNPSSKKKPKQSGKFTARTTPASTVRKGLFQSSPASKKPTQGAKKTKPKNPTVPQRRQSTRRSTMEGKRGYVCSKCNKGGHYRSTCKIATLLFG